MTTLTILIVVAFVLGYACIATESLLKVNKAAIALLMFVACWTLYMFDPMQYLTAIHGYTGDLSGMAAAVTSIIQEPPDHYALVSHLIGLSASQSSALLPLHSAAGYQSA